MGLVLEPTPFSSWDSVGLGVVISAPPCIKVCLVCGSIITPFPSHHCKHLSGSIYPRALPGTASFAPSPNPPSYSFSYSLCGMHHALTRNCRDRVSQEPVRGNGVQTFPLCSFFRCGTRHPCALQQLKTNISIFLLRDPVTHSAVMSNQSHWVNEACPPLKFLKCWLAKYLGIDWTFPFCLMASSFCVTQKLANSNTGRKRYHLTHFVTTKYAISWNLQSRCLHLDTTNHWHSLLHVSSTFFPKY